jgi:hypothetical protein
MGTSPFYQFPTDINQNILHLPQHDHNFILGVDFFGCMQEKLHISF